MDSGANYSFPLDCEKKRPHRRERNNRARLRDKKRKWKGKRSVLDGALATLNGELARANEKREPGWEYERWRPMVER